MNVKSCRVKVMHVLLSLEYGGAEKVVVNLANKLQGDNIDFSICVLDRVGPLEKDLKSTIRIDCINRGGKRGKGIDVITPFKLAKIMRRDSPDVVHLHNFTCMFYGVIAGKLAGVPRIIFTQHGTAGNKRMMRIILTMLSFFLNKATTCRRIKTQHSRLSRTRSFRSGIRKSGISSFWV